jgi:hypothetical protein
MHYSTHENHFKFGWGSGQYNFNNKIGKYWVDFGKAKYLPRSFREECIRAAKLIRENTTHPLLVCFSGGIDSEVIVRSLQEAKIKFEVAIMKLHYNDMQNANHHDNKYAFDYVKTHSIPYHVVDIDFANFIKHKFEIEADKYQANYPGTLVHNEIIKKFSDYHCILGGGDISLKRHRFNGRPKISGMFIEESQVSISAVETAYQQNHGVSNRFFMHTPELMLSWLTDPDVSHWIKYESAFANRFGVINFNGIKAFVLYKHWPDMIPRSKYTGLEKLTLWDKNKENEHDPEIIQIVRKVEEKYSKGSEMDVIIDYNELMYKLLPS